MGSLMNLDQHLIEALVTAVVFWAWFFILAPARAFKTGIELEDPPIFFKMSAFKGLRFLALIAVLGAGFLFKDDFAQLKLIDSLQDPKKIPGLILGALLCLLLLWGLPEMTARGRVKREESPGEWRTPMLVLFRWIWLGLLLLVYLPLADATGDQYDVPLGGGLALAGAIVFVLWWGLPSMRVARIAQSDDDPHAMASLARVRWVGLPAWFQFVIQRLGRDRADAKSGTHKLCTSCMRPIDNIDAYGALRFDACPHCGEMIPPAFSLEDYIQYYATRMQEIHNAKAGGAKAKGRAPKHEDDLVQRILRAILTLAVRERTTDLHILCEDNSLLVRARTDGVLFTLAEIPELLLRPMISAIKVQCNLDISERRKPQDGSFKTLIDEKNLDVRVNTSPSSTGETASLRLLYRQEVLGSLKKLGLSHRNYRLFSEYIFRPHGMILVTGPTGSGKSTTLYNALATIANGKRNIITLEDPIEFEIDGITQMQIDAGKGFDFVSGLRSILRQDPDVIMVGEIRDDETAKMAIDAAMTGHLVFSTLHTIDTSTTVSRLLDLGVDPQRHADALLMLVAQRLVRITCDLCRQDYELTRAELEELGLPGAPERLILKRGTGCPRCHETGYYGREGIYEIMTPDEKLRRMIIDQAAPMDIRVEARRGGMRTLMEDGLSKALIGRTTIDEVLRVTH